MDKAKTRAVLQSIGVLAAIALVCGLLLGAVYTLTRVDPRTEAYARFAQDTELTFTIPERDPGEGRETDYTVPAGSRTMTGHVDVYALSDDGSTHAFCVRGEGGYRGDVQLYVYIEGGAVAKITVGENGETFLGQLEASGFYAQFLNVPVEELLSGSGVDYVSGATRSSNAVTAAIGAAAGYYREYLAEGANG